MSILNYIISDTERASSRFIKAISFVPDERLGFAPSKDSMTAREIGAHIIIVNKAYAAYLLNLPRPYSSFEELFQLSKAQGEGYVSTQKLVSDLSDSFKILLGQLQSLPDLIIDQEVQTVRGSEKALTLLERLAPHIYVHAGQIDYLQTIWGDTEVHL